MTIIFVSVTLKRHLNIVSKMTVFIPWICLPSHLLVLNDLEQLQEYEKEYKCPEDMKATCVILGTYMW